MPRIRRLDLIDDDIKFDVIIEKGFLHSSPGCLGEDPDRTVTLGIFDIDTDSVCPRCGLTARYDGINFYDLAEQVTTLSQRSDLAAVVGDLDNDWESRLRALEELRHHPVLHEHFFKGWPPSLLAADKVLTEREDSLLYVMTEELAANPRLLLGTITAKLEPPPWVELPGTPLDKYHAAQREYATFLIEGTPLLAHSPYWHEFDYDLALNLWFRSWPSYGPDRNLKLVPPYALERLRSKMHYTPTDPSDTPAIFETAGRLFADGGEYANITKALEAARAL